MNRDLIELSDINPLLAKLVDGNDLSSDESFQLFSTIFQYDTEGYHFASLISAIHSKGETSDELLGLIKAYTQLSAKLNIKGNPKRIIDISGSGGGKLKTMNVSTASSFVLAAAGYNVAKASYFGVTSPTGSADIFAAFGVDITKLTKTQIEEAIEEIGICPFFAAFISPKLQNLGKITLKIFADRQLQIRTPMHLATNAFSPYPTSYRVYGCYRKKYLRILSELFLKMGLERSIVVYGHAGIPEASNIGKTTIFEQNGSVIKSYVLDPKDFGVKISKKSEIESGGKEQNVIDFLRVLKGKDNGAKRDLVAINSGLALYALKDVVSIKLGVNKARKIIDSGKAYLVLDELVKMVGSKGCLEQYKILD